MEDCITKYLEQAAASSDTQSMEYDIRVAKGIAEILEEPILQEIIDGIEIPGYSNGIEVQLDTAEVYARRGNPSGMNNAFHEAKRFAAKIRRDISGEVARITGLLQE